MLKFPVHTIKMVKGFTLNTVPTNPALGQRHLLMPVFLPLKCQLFFEIITIKRSIFIEDLYLKA